MGLRHANSEGAEWTWGGGLPGPNQEMARVVYVATACSSLMTGFHRWAATLRSTASVSSGSVTAPLRIPRAERSVEGRWPARSGPRAWFRSGRL